MKDITTFQRQQGAWADKTFPGQTITGKIKHLQREVAELLESPSDLSEIADCFSLLMDIARKAGYPASTVVKAAFEKLEINKARTWGPADADGVIEHVKAT